MPAAPHPEAIATTTATGTPVALASRRPVVPAERLVAEMVPPPRFAGVSFGSYLPDPTQPSQSDAVTVLAEFAAAMNAPPAPRRGWFRKAAAHAAAPAGVYLDGGYGVGKTHLLASLWHAAPGPKAFGTFVELTNLVGALGFQQAVRTLSGHQLLCIDEFELDDPGDTVLVSTLLSRLVEAGVKLAATSNTLPQKLGEGRFAAADFLREIQGLSAHFRPVRIDGQDYRHRGLPAAPPPYADAEVAERAADTPGAALDDFGDLLDHLSVVHPSRYGALLDDVHAVFLRGVRPVEDQSTALRLVVLADRMYDRELPITASGIPFDQVFSAEMLRGGYRKKYLRAISRLVALARDSAR
ncbi:cell division protein ZapE [Kitasatospora sp. NBC_01287]|uniref:cell division protein ZapE n=1 Tax=Kitasatospora sp. NBC_01287 TaxID=2903573 RepID=UPI00225384CD|nr:cell division protein ZapE [Kitasatospora sp. NBC_01287]MCX4746278.1 cell division protein ZapE [Kitasatospora sp. NBC_01287]